MNTAPLTELTELKLGHSGHLRLDARTGAPAQFIDHDDPERTFLLDDDVSWHSVEHQWGSGFVITDAGSGRWLTPQDLDVTPDGLRAGFDVLPTLRLEVTRIGGSTLRESFRLTNTGGQTLTIGSLGLQTPFADHYPDARGALARSVHAHVFAGGSGAWVAAQPMSGTGRVLGLAVTAGRIDAYSIESRNTSTLSNARGHLVLHITDHARSPHSFGGQRPLVLQPGTSYELEWVLDWYDCVDDLLAAVAAPAELDSLTARIGSPLTVRTEPGAVVTSLDSRLQIERADSASAHHVQGDAPGTYPIEVLREGKEPWRSEVLFHPPVEEVIRRRCDYILRHQRSTERPGLLAQALVPIDTRTLLRQSTNAWSDWTDGSERTGMALFLQRARTRGLVGEDVEEVLDGWGVFARAHLLDDSFAPRRGSQDHRSGIRLYDAPWLSMFFCERHLATGDPRHLETAARIQFRAFELGAEQFLGVQGPEATAMVIDALAGAGRNEDAARLRAHLVSSAHHFLQLGRDLPAHEVSYEQSIVAPLLSLWSEAHRVTGADEFRNALEDCLPWLLSFGGLQPHVRLRHVSLRHWDGYWFGIDRQWGDVFPHHWSTLTAGVLARLPASLKDDRTERIAEEILRANLCSYFEDGSATSAFVMPSCVDGRAAHRADPLANDQDWHLATLLRLQSEGLIGKI